MPLCPAGVWPLVSVPFRLHDPPPPTPPPTLKDGHSYLVTNGEPGFRGAGAHTQGHNQLKGKALKRRLSASISFPDPQLCDPAEILPLKPFVSSSISPNGENVKNDKGSMWGSGWNSAQVEAAQGWGGDKALPWAWLRLGSQALLPFHR